MESLEPSVIAAALALPPMLFASLAALRFGRDWRRGRLRAPRWSALGVSLSGLTTIAAVVAVDQFADVLDASQAFHSSHIPFFPVYVGEIGLTLALLAGWLLDDAERRHRHLHDLAQDQERRLRETEQTFASVVEHAPAAVIIVAPAGRAILSANLIARRWLGGEVGALEGTVLDDWLASPFSDDPEQLLSTLADDEPGSARYVVFQDAGDERREAEVAAASVVFEGRPAFVLLARDVSEIEQARRTAEAASHAKNHFLTNVSHEIRTPLNGILGMTELALDGELPRPVQENLETVQHCARDLLLIVDDVLDFSRLEAGKLELNLGTFCPERVVSDVVQHLAPRARAKDLTLVDVPRRDLPQWVVGDASRVRQVLVNLIGNAIKFTDAGEVEVRVQPRGRVVDGRQTIRLAVRDTGCGIEDTARDRIFEAFRQADSSLTREYGGTGLGLALSRQLVRIMSGELELESSPGRGSTFTVDLPLIVDTGATPGETVETLAGRRALIVHPSSAVQAALSEKLLMLGVRARSVGDLVAAASVAAAAREEESPVEAVFVDCALLDGGRTSSMLEEARRQLGVDVPWILVSRQPLVRLPAAASGAVLLPVARHLLADVLENSLQFELPDGVIQPGEPRGAEDQLVLVVEDNVVNRRLVTTLLQRAGYTVRACENGQEAVDILDSEPCALVLMDVQMPVMDGLEATRRLRRDARYQSLPIIALTAHANASDRELCLGAGMNEYLTKPVRRDELLTTVERHLGAPLTTR